VRTADDLREALTAQIASPVPWVKGVRTFVTAGCGTFAELGPGRVLSGLVRQIAPTASVVGSRFTGEADPAERRPA
jgi:[acyl-carrier-protein] S-malonyltransferase